MAGRIAIVVEAGAPRRICSTADDTATSARVAGHIATAEVTASSRARSVACRIAAGPGASGSGSSCGCDEARRVVTPPARWQRITQVG